MIETLSKITEMISLIYFARQYAVALVLFVLGFICVYAITNSSRKTNDDIPIIYSFLLGFPCGLSMFTIGGIILLISGIKYSVLSSSVTTLIIVILIVVLNRPAIKTDFFNFKTLILFAVAVILAFIAVSGVVSVGFSNDSMYYYSAYPHEIVTNGYLSGKMDVFLTDAGQGTAIINTLPFLFGFNESFGIHNCYQLSFILFFFYAMYEQAVKSSERKVAVLISAIVTLLLYTTMPYVLISKWIIANMYFMATLFFCLYLNYRFKGAENNAIVLRMLFIVMLSFIRIEGAIFAGFILLVYLMQKGTKKKEVILQMLPVTMLQLLYFIKLYAVLHIEAAYTFMTKGKAVIAVAFCIFVIVYSLFFSGDALVSDKLKEKMTLISPVYATFAGLTFVNVILMVYDRSLFLSNVKTFVLNMTRNSGWSYFVAFVFVMVILIPKVNIHDNYFDYFTVGFFLVAFAACFARGDELRVDLYDSGNRVMLQIVPFVIYGFGFRFIKAFDILRHKEQQSG